MTDYTARIRAKGLDSTGVTEHIARKLHANRGTYLMGIFEARVDRTSDDADGNHKVELILTQVEPSTTTDLDDHLRNLTKALHTNRVLHSEDDQLTIDGQDDLAPAVNDVILAGRGLELGDEPDGDETYDEVDSEGNPVDPDEDPDATHAAERDTDQDKTWEYAEGEGPRKPLAAVPNPFATAT